MPNYHYALRRRRHVSDCGARHHTHVVILLVWGASLVGSCTVRIDPGDSSTDHPANPQAEQVPFVPPPNVLTRSDPLPAPEEPAKEEQGEEQHGAQPQEGAAGHKKHAASSPSAKSEPAKEEQGEEHGAQPKEGADAGHKKHAASSPPSKSESAKEEQGHEQASKGKDKQINDVQEEKQAASLPKEVGKQLGQLLDAYLAIGDKLAEDSVEGIPVEAGRVKESIDNLAKRQIPTMPDLWRDRMKEVRTVQQQSDALAQATGLPEARRAYGQLSDAVEKLVQVTGIPGDYEKQVRGFICGMFKEAPRKGVWLQAGEEPRNPYFGKQMLDCHTERLELPTAGSPDHAGPKKAGDEKSKSGGAKEHEGHEEGK